MRKIVTVFAFVMLIFLAANAQSDYAINFSRSFLYLGNKYNLTLIKEARMNIRSGCKTPHL